MSPALRRAACDTPGGAWHAQLQRPPMSMWDAFSTRPSEAVDVYGRVVPLRLWSPSADYGTVKSVLAER